MANFAESIGRTNTLSQSTKSLSDLALNLRNQKARDRQLSIQEQDATVNRAIKIEEFNKQKEQNKIDNTIIPVDTALKAFDHEEVQSYVLEKAKANGIIENVGGQDIIRKKPGEQFLATIMSPKGPYLDEISNIRLQAITKKLEQTDAALAQYMEKKPDAKPEDDKNLASLMQQKKSLSDSRIQQLHKLDIVKKMKPLIDKHTPASIEKYVDDGMRNQSILKSSDIAKEQVKSRRDKDVKPEVAFKRISAIDRAIADLDAGQISEETSALAQTFNFNIGGDKELTPTGKARVKAALLNEKRYLKQFTPQKNIIKPPSKADIDYYKKNYDMTEQQVMDKWNKKNAE